MTSDVDICNQALAAIGTRSTIQALTENSAEALQCNVIYATTRDSLLREYRWGCATKLAVALALLQAAPGTPENASGTALPAAPLPWNYAYAQPADCLMARRIVPLTLPTALSPPLFPVTGPATPSSMLNGPAVRFEIVQIADVQGNPVKAIVTNQSQALLDYTVATTNVGLFDVDLVVALIGRLAAKLVIPLAGDKTLAKEAAAAGARVEATAAARDANEKLTVHDRDAPWIRGRGYVGGWADGRGGSYDDSI